MALSKIYIKRLEQLNEELDASIEKRIKKLTYLDSFADTELTFLIYKHKLLDTKSKIELLKKLEEL